MEFNDFRKLDVSMITYLKNKIADEFPEIIKGKATTLALAADHHLFNILRDKKEANPLEEERALAFHHTTVTQLLFVSTR